MKIESELKVVAHGDLPTLKEVEDLVEPPQEEALFRIIANTKSVEIVPPQEGASEVEISPRID